MDTDMTKFTNFIAIALCGGFALVLAQCAPFEDEGITLPGAPEATIAWSFIDAIDSTGVVTGVDYNRVAVSASEVQGAFLHLWDFGNGMTSNEPSDTVYYPVQGDYELSYSVHTDGGMGQASAIVSIAETLELPCDGTLALLTGCDTPKSWKLSNEIGAVSVGPSPYSTEWYVSPADGQTEFQDDDRYQFTEEGLYLYDNNGSTMNPFDGYVETEMEIPASTYFLTPGSGTSGEDQINLGAFSEVLCGFMGIWDSGPYYDIVEITEDRLVIHGPTQSGDCQQTDGWFTIVFVTAP
jgi:hypothetical protein